MYVLTTGGRTLPEHLDAEETYAIIENVLTEYTQPGDTIVHGAAKGFDSAVDLIARQLGFATLSVPANWGLNGKAAGPMRNEVMSNFHPVRHLISFPGGRGSADMTQRCLSKGIPVISTTHLFVSLSPASGLKE